MKTLNFKLLAVALALNGCDVSGSRDVATGIYECHEVWEGSDHRVFNQEKPYIVLNADGGATLRLYVFGSQDLTNIEGKWRQDGEWVIVHVEKNEGAKINTDLDLRFRKVSKSIIIDDGGDGPDSPVKYMKKK